MEEELKINEQEVQESPTGRSAMMNRWRERNPDYDGDPDDDTLYDHALGEIGDYETKYNELNEVNAALAQRISEDPKLGALIAGIMDKKNPAYVLAKLYGKDFMDDEEALTAMEEGYAEYLDGVNSTTQSAKQAQENFLESMKRVDAYANANGLGDDQIEELRMNLVQAADNMLNGTFDDAFIATVAKGLTYDADIQEAADTGYVEGKNEKVEMQFGKDDTSLDLPAMGTGTNTQRKVQEKQPQKGSFFDEMEDV